MPPRDSSRRSHSTVSGTTPSGFTSSPPALKRETSSSRLWSGATKVLHSRYSPRIPYPAPSPSTVSTARKAAISTPSTTPRGKRSKRTMPGPPKAPSSMHLREARTSMTPDRSTVSRTKSTVPTSIPSTRAKRTLR